MAQNEFSYLEHPTVTISEGESESSVSVPLMSYGLMRVDMPVDAWDAAGLTFLTSEDGQTFRELATAAISVAANQSVPLDPTTFGAGFRFLKVRSGTSGTPVNQTADRVLTLVTRPL